MRRLAALLLILAAPALACEMMDYTRVKASQHVTVFQAAEGTTAVVTGNIVAVMGRDATLIVDTGQFPGTARRVITELREMKAPPVRYVVNTHWHGDHLLGNAQFRDAYPGVRFIAHSHTIKEATRVYTGFAARMAEKLPKLVEDLQKQRAGSKSSDEKIWLEKTIECIERAIPETQQVVYFPPDTVVDDTRTLDLGGLTAVVRHLGTGNTPGDLVVWVDEDRLVASGDMVVAPVPYAIGSALDPWVATLDALQALDAKVLVPGHGPVMRDATYLADVKALIASTRTQVAALKATGVKKEDAAREIDTSAFRARYVDTPMRRQAFEQFYLEAVVQKAWAEPKPAS
jgi:glyoxylase-like metal-dependent hydrolase (beta-lactamase superfamily II)